MSEKIDLWKEQVAEDPENELARFSLAQAYFAEKDWGNALSQYEEALARKPDWMMATILRGQCLIKLGRIDEAKATLLEGRALAVKQNHKDPQMEIDEILEELG
ncbi:MAG: CDC27 family protein [Acidobacteriota bacterium]